MNSIFKLIFIVMSVQAYFEQKIIRRAINHTFSTQETHLNPKNCNTPNKHNRTYVSQICFTRDLFFNMEVIIQNVTLEMTLDLSSPWTWYKSSKCKKCKTNLYNQTYDSTTWQDQNIQGTIQQNDSVLRGQFKKEKLKFLAYDSQTNMSFFERLANEEEMESISNLKMLELTSMTNPKEYLADGAVGFGFGYVETEQDEAQEDTDFLEALIKEDTTIQISRQLFALYILDIGVYFPHYVVQFGGFDYKYAHKHDKNIVWIDRLDNSEYYWMIKTNSINLKGQKKLEFANLQAILTLSSSWIELPLRVMQPVLLQLNEVGLDCKIVDPNFQVVYCQNLTFPDNFYDLKLQLNLGENELIELSSFRMFKNCSDESAQKCFLNLKLGSNADTIILGEPFIKDNYLIFENSPGKFQRIGLLSAATNMYYQDPVEYHFFVYIKMMMYVLILFTLFFFCFLNLKRWVKDIIRFMKYGQEKDNQNLRLNQEENDMHEEVVDEINEMKKQNFNIEDHSL